MDSLPLATADRSGLKPGAPWIWVWLANLGLVGEHWFGARDLGLVGELWFGMRTVVW